jgi:hypothetical protein
VFLNLLLSIVLGQAGDGSTNDRLAAQIPAERMKQMRAMADGITIKELRPSGAAELKRIADPLCRYNDPARQFSDGSVWAWGETGRPAALFTLAKERTPSGNFQWVCEMTSLASGPIVAEIEGTPQWRPAEPGIVLKPIPHAPAPADTDPKRLRQMRELARKFKGVEYFAPGNQTTEERYELRTLPQPIRRYSDAASRLIDGAAFVIAYGLNPELVLLIEARKEKGAAEPTWSFGMARISIARVYVEFDGKEIWTHPGGYSNGPQDIYWNFNRPAQP